MPTTRVKVELPVPGAGIGLTLKVAVTPAGRPLAERVMAESKPFSATVEIFEMPLLPGSTVIELGEAEMVKLGKEELNADFGLIITRKPVSVGLLSLPAVPRFLTTK